MTELIRGGSSTQARLLLRAPVELFRLGSASTGSSFRSKGAPQYSRTHSANAASVRWGEQRKNRRGLAAVFRRDRHHHRHQMRALEQPKRRRGEVENDTKHN